MLSKNESMTCKVELSGHPNRHYLQMRVRCLWLLLACLVTSIATSAPAVWAPHELIVNLHDLPKHYSCDDLWYKFRAILLTLGARQDMEILPYRCEGYSPQVQLKFSAPRLVQGANARWSDLTAVTRTVQIAPGSPDKLDNGDCELMAQVKGEPADVSGRANRLVSAAVSTAQGSWPTRVRGDAENPGAGAGGGRFQVEEHNDPIRLSSVAERRGGLVLRGVVRSVRRDLGAR